MRFNENMLSDNNNNIIVKTFHSKVSPVKRQYSEHHHTECELSLFIAGSGVYAANGISYSFKAGDMFLFGSNEAHCITDIYEKINLLNIHFEPRVLWEHSESVDLLNIFAARNKNFSNKFSSDDKILREYIIGLETELINKKPCYGTKVRYMLFSALIHIIRSYNYIDTENAIGSKLSATGGLKKAINYINENLERNLTLKEIADYACMTQTYFSAVFKKYNGISPWEYITIKRVEKAVELLKSSDRTKLEIWEMCGFQSSSNFYKAFIKITGKHPGDYSCK